MNIIELKRKHRVGKQFKGITRKKGDDQPLKAVRANNGSTHVVPQRGHKYRTPTGLPGTPNGKKVTTR